MPPNPTCPRSLSRRLARLLLACLLAAGCATPPAPAPTPAPSRAVVGDEPLGYDAAVRAVAADLVSQLRIAAAALAAPRAREAAGTPASVVIDPFIDAQSGYGTRAGLRLQDGVAAALRAELPAARVAALSPQTLPGAQWAMTGSLAAEARAGGARGYRLDVALVDARSARVAAQSTAWLADRAPDMAALPAHQDSPLFVNDRQTRALVATSRAQAGQPADTTWFAQLPAQAIVAAALEASPQDARGAQALYRQAASLPGGRSLRTLSGLYVTQLRLGQVADAERTFGELIAVAFAENGVSIRFLFAVGSTELFADPRLAQQYRIWMRQLAQHVVRSRSCVEVQGHSSRSGDERYNDVLSLQRAEAVRRLMQQESPGAAALTRAVGRGFRDNLVGSGSDDARDAIDRRVDVRLVGCPVR